MRLVKTVSGEGAGINSANVAMSATETITTNARVLGADPLVKDGFGEEDMLTLVLPYIKTAREGVLAWVNSLKLMAHMSQMVLPLADTEEIWWLETIGGHHWIAKRVPDDTYVTTQTNLVSIIMNLKIQTTILPHQIFGTLSISIIWI